MCRRLRLIAKRKAISRKTKRSMRENLFLRRSYCIYLNTVTKERRKEFDQVVMCTKKKRERLRSSSQPQRSRRSSGRRPTHIPLGLQGHHARTLRHVGPGSAAVQKRFAILASCSSETLNRHIRTGSLELHLLVLLLGMLVHVRLLLLNGQLDIDGSQIIGIVSIAADHLLLVQVRAASTGTTAGRCFGHLERKRSRSVLLQKRSGSRRHRRLRVG